MEDKFVFEVYSDEENERIDKFISKKLLNKTRNFIQKLIENGNVLVNEKHVKNNYKVKKGNIIIINIPVAVDITVKPQNIELDIVYEDADLLVVNKPKGMVVHPAPGHYDKTLVNALLFHCKGNLSGINGEVRPGIIHRIDKDTSGLLIVAKNDFAHNKLSQQIKSHSFKREYEAVVFGNIKNDQGVINAPIGRDVKDRKRMAVTEKNSKNATTYYKVIKRYKDFTHLRLILKTGRTHQIRVHMAYIGHPVAGDMVYKKRPDKWGLCGQCLHAKFIGFVHPRSGKYIEFESELPKYFKEFLKKIS